MKINSRDSLKKVFLWLSIFFGAFGILNAEAHWTTTHEHMVDLVCDTFQNDGKGQYCEFLKSIPTDKERTYLDLLKQGVVDADLRVNGIYAVDRHCVDPSMLPEDPSCPKIVYNDIPEMIVGDHGYNPNTRAGFHSLQEKIDRVNMDWPEWIGDPIGQKLLAVLKGNTTDKKKETLLRLMRKANAADLVEFFYKRALNEWKNGHPGDAFYNLGIALHGVQDLTVPHHSRLITGYSDISYEGYVWETYLESGAVRPDISGFYLNKTPEGWVRMNAKESFDWDPDNPSATASKSVSSGVASTAGFLTYFFDKAHIELPGPEPNPTIVGSVDTPGYAFDIYVSGSYAYIADGHEGLQVIDIADPTSPTIVGSVDTTDQAYGVYGSGTYAYVADYSAGLLVIQIFD